MATKKDIQENHKEMQMIHEAKGIGLNYLIDNYKANGWKELGANEKIVLVKAFGLCAEHILKHQKGSIRAGGKE